MEKIFLPRGRGKTSTLIEISKKSGATMVVRNHTIAKRVYELADKEIPYPLTYQQVLLNRNAGLGVNGLLIDNADMFIEYATGPNPIRAITMNIPKNLFVESKKS